MAPCLSFFLKLFSKNLTPWETRPPPMNIPYFVSEASERNLITWRLSRTTLPDPSLKYSLFSLEIALSCEPLGPTSIAIRFVVPPGRIASLGRADKNRAFSEKGLSKPFEPCRLRR